MSSYLFRLTRYQSTYCAQFSGYTYDESGNLVYRSACPKKAFALQYDTSSVKQQKSTSMRYAELLRSGVQYR